MFVDGGYTGSLLERAKQMFGYKAEALKGGDQHRFVVPPKRWIVERALAWLNWSRRLSKDVEPRHDATETMTHIAVAHQPLRRPALEPGQALRYPQTFSSRRAMQRCSRRKSRS